MSGEINVVSRTQMIVVEPVTKTIGLINGNGPIGPQGYPGEKWFSGLGDPTTVVGSIDGDWYLDVTDGDVYELVAAVWTLRGNIRGPQGVQGIQGPQGNVGIGANLSVQLQTLRDSASAAATNNGATTFTAVSDPNFRVHASLAGVNYVMVQGRIGGSLVAATKIRVQYAVTNDPNLATGSASWTTLCDTDGGHTLSTTFGNGPYAVPAGAKVNNCLLRCGIYGGDAIADPTITCCILNFYA